VGRCARHEESGGPPSGLEVFVSGKDWYQKDRTVVLEVSNVVVLSIRRGRRTIRWASTTPFVRI
jgi:hypothetical protein